MNQFLVGWREEKFRNYQKVLNPISKTFSSSEWENSARVINEFLDTKEAAVKYKLLLFFILIELTSLIKFFNFFNNLNIEKQNKVMQTFFDSNIPLFRKGFWGLNTLSKMGVYSQSSLYPHIKYKLREIKK